MGGRSLLQFYDDPPGHPPSPTREKDRGSCDIDPLSPVVDPTVPFGVFVNRDENLCFKLMQFGSDYLSRVDGPPPHSLLDDVRVAVNRALAAMGAGDEVRNVDIFTQIFGYVREVVAAADRRDVGSTQAVSCGDDNGDSASHASNNRVIQRQVRNHILVENISLAAFEQHEEDIWNLADDENGSMELWSRAPAEGARAVVLRIWVRMINEDVSWAVLFGGARYIVFFLEKTTVREAERHQLTISRACNAFVVPPSPSLSSILIALLLSDKGTASYKATTTAFEARESIQSVCTGVWESETLDSSPDSNGTRSAQQGQKDAGITQAEPPVSTASEAATVVAEIIGLSDHCIMSYPGEPWKRRDAFTKVTSENAWSRAVNVPDANVLEDEKTPRLFSFSNVHVVGFDCSRANEAMFKAEGHKEVRCAVKTFHGLYFNDFRREIDAYQQLAGKPFAPQFYAAYAGFDSNQPIGVIVTEPYKKLFDSFDGMVLVQKRIALRYLKQMHRAGYVHCSMNSASIGLNSNGDVVFLDFAHTVKQRCETCEAPSKFDKACVEVRSLTSQLFGPRPPSGLEEEDGESGQEKGEEASLQAADRRSQPGDSKRGGRRNKRKRHT